MKLALAVGLLGLTFISACTPDLMLASSKPANLSGQDIAQIKAAMTYSMFDAGSAQFRNMRGYDAVFQDGHVERRACYEVNGKNRMGGYVGFEERGAKKINGKWEATAFCHQIGYNAK